jgi:hypothetical protein
MATHTLDKAAANEELDITAIILAINTSTSSVGQKIKSTFLEKFSSPLTAARKRQGANRGTHYDFEIEVGGVWKKVEHKGSQLFRVPKSDEKPWAGGVQFHNGGCEKYSLAKKYAKTHYDLYIGSGSLKTEFQLESPTPSFDDWFKLDCKTQADPKTAFGKELKRKVRAARGPRTSLLEKRADVLAALEITDADKAVFIAEVLPIANEALEQKDYWLSIHGSLNGDFNAVWYPKFTIASINDVTFKKNLDLDMTFHCSENYTFNGILRWGKGAGFSCLRVDLK